MTSTGDTHHHLPGLRAEGLTVSIEGCRILSDISFETSRGDVAVFVGPSGSGKTTLLNAIAGLVPLESGQVWVRDRNVVSLSPSDRNVGMVFQDFALYPTKTVYGNLEFPLRMRHVPRISRRKRVLEIATHLKIDSLIDRKVQTLSGGEKQRVALGRALVRKPHVFLLDEPMSNVDAAMQDGLRALILDVQKSERIPCIYVTHDQVEAWRIADKIGVLKDGNLLQYGTPRDLYSMPSNRFVAEFISDVPISFAPISSLSNESRELICKRWPAARTIGLRLDDSRFLLVSDGPRVHDTSQVAIPARYEYSERFAEHEVYVALVDESRFRALASSQSSEGEGSEKGLIVAKLSNAFLFGSSGEIIKSRDAVTEQ